MLGSQGTRHTFGLDGTHRFGVHFGYHVVILLEFLTICVRRHVSSISPQETMDWHIVPRLISLPVVPDAGENDSNSKHGFANLCIVGVDRVWAVYNIDVSNAHDTDTDRDEDDDNECGVF